MLYNRNLIYSSRSEMIVIAYRCIIETAQKRPEARTLEHFLFHFEKVSLLPGSRKLLVWLKEDTIVQG